MYQVDHICKKAIPSNAGITYIKFPTAFTIFTAINNKNISDMATHMPANLISNLLIAEKLENLILPPLFFLLLL